jgi:predicted kinase
MNYTKPTFNILVGPPLSGKSTYRKKLETMFSDLIIICRDDIVMELCDSDIYEECFNSVNQKEVDKLLNDRLSNALMNRKNIVIDMTNLSVKRRKSFLSNVPSDYVKIAHVFEWNYDTLVKRNDHRKELENKYIPIHVIKSMVDSFQPVKKEEGFDKIIYVN